MKKLFTAETRSSQRSGYFLTKNSLLCVLSASALQFSSPASQDTQNKLFLLTCVASEHSFYFAEKVFHANRLTLIAVKPFS